MATAPLLPAFPDMPVFTVLTATSLEWLDIRNDDPWLPLMSGPPPCLGYLYSSTKLEERTLSLGTRLQLAFTVASYPGHVGGGKSHFSLLPRGLGTRLAFTATCP